MIRCFIPTELRRIVAKTNRQKSVEPLVFICFGNIVCSAFFFKRNVRWLMLLDKSSVISIRLAHLKVL